MNGNRCCISAKVWIYKLFFFFSQMCYTFFFRRKQAILAFAHACVASQERHDRCKFVAIFGASALATVWAFTTNETELILVYFFAKICCSFVLHLTTIVRTRSLRASK